MAFRIGKNCQIDPTTIINVKEGYLGDHSIVRAGARIEGQRVEIGREAFIDLGAVIGGGSCFDPGAYLKAGDWLHMGMNSQINVARGVDIGHEFGCGIESKIFTHGAYIDAYNLGAPVQWESVKIGNSVWMPNAWVNPGVTVGDNVIVAARSLVNKDLPAGCMAGGVPVQILKRDFLPKILSDSEKISLLEKIAEAAWLRRLHDQGKQTTAERPYQVRLDRIFVQELQLKSEFQIAEKKIQGEVSAFGLLLKDQLRRNGIRFRYENREGQWQPW
jgi:acetyltransferase-like isoleucine patch superfamily enzyme